MSQLKKGAVLSYIKMILTNIGGLIITPYIIRMLGNEEYGLYTLIGSFVGYLSILDLGLNNAIVRYVAQYRAENDQKGEENFLAISLILYMLIGILLIIFGGLFYYNIENLFGDTLTNNQLGKAKLMMLILILNIGFTIPGGAFTGICTGYQAFVFPAWLAIVKYISRFILIFSILYLGAGAIGIVIVDTLLNLGVILTTMWFVFYKLKVKIKLHEFNLQFIKEIFGYSFWIFVFGLIYQLQWRTGQVILGIHLNPENVAIYGVGIMLGIYFTTFGNIINRLILPKAVKSISENSNVLVLTEQMTKIARVSLILLLFVFGGFIVIGQDFIKLWVGETYSNSYYIAAGIMFVYILPIAQGYAHSLLEAKKLLRFKTLGFLFASIIGMIAGGILSYTYDELGMIVGLISPLFIFQWFIMNNFYSKKLNLNISWFLRQVFPFFLFFIIIIPISYLFAAQFNTSWINFIIKGFVYSIFYGVGMYTLTNNFEKQLLFNALKK